MKPAVRVYGSWTSPISAAMVARGEVRLADLQCDGDDVYWIEARPVEAGRCVVVRHRGGEAKDVVAAPFSARTAVHEYGGGALLAVDGAVYFSNAADKRLYVCAPPRDPTPLTPDMGDVRYADMIGDRWRERLICVVEDHRRSTVINSIATIARAGGEPVTLVSGNDFYSTARLSPDGARLAWLTWNHPFMPWDSTELWVADVDAAGNLSDARLVAGGEHESVFQPAWSPDGVLYLCSDRTGWWNLHRFDGATLINVAPMDAECGRPLWQFHMSAYAFCDDGRIAMAVVQDGNCRLLMLQPESGIVERIELPYTALGSIDSLRGGVVLTAAGPRDASRVVRVDTATGRHVTIRTASDVAIDGSVLSEPRPLTFAGEGGAIAHAFFYPPRNASFVPPPGELPPLVVGVHGGPTSARTTALDPSVQFWTSRGFAYVDVNYGGSTGYGRAYRERLTGEWGVVDVGDCVAAARSLADDGVVDGARLLIEGGSAGGYVVLCALVFHDVFAAGASHYGVADIELLRQETHKFEATYEVRLIGPYPDRRDLYLNRSPIHFIDRVRGAVLLLQGSDDPIVPPIQTQMMFERLRAAGVTSACVIFPGEQHGFREAKNIERALQAELTFFSRVLRLPHTEDLPPLEIANLGDALASRAGQRPIDAMSQ